MTAPASSGRPAQVLDAQVVALSAENDLAVLKVPALEGGMHAIQVTAGLKSALVTSPVFEAKAHPAMAPPGWRSSCCIAAQHVRRSSGCQVLAEWH